VFLHRLYQYTAVCMCSMFSIYCAISVCSQPLPVHCSLVVLIIYCAVFPSLSVQDFLSRFFSGTTNALHSICSLFTVPSVFLPRHYYYTGVYLCSVFTAPSVFLPRHYRYSGVYLCLVFSGSSVFLPRPHHYTGVCLCSVFTAPSVFLPRHYHYTGVYLFLVFTVPSVRPSWHYHYPAVYFCSLFTMPIPYALLP
jgi:hypothetical protein